MFRPLKAEHLKGERSHNMTKSNAIKRILAIFIAFIMVIGVFGTTSDISVSAAPPNQTKGHANDGVPVQNLYNKGNFIYMGTYDHAKTLSSTVSGNTSSKEGTAKPILWRIAGEENSSGKSTLYSHFILDSRQFKAAPTSSNAVWLGSDLDSWLNSTFKNSFTAKEQQLLATTEIKDLSSSDNRVFYIPYTNPGDLNKAFLDANSTVTSTLGSIDFSSIQTATSNDSSAGLRSGTNQEAVHYWNRNPHTFTTDYAYFTNTDGKSDGGTTGGFKGVRPVFRLDTSDILFASEIIQSPIKNSQTTAEFGTYKDANEITADVNYKAYKLTVLNNSVEKPDDFLYDYDETLSLTNSQLVMRPGEVLDLVEGNGTLASGYDKLVYKLVEDDETTPSNRITQRYGSATGTNLKISAKNDFLDSNAQSQPIYAGKYTGYIWWQKDNTIASHEGGKPLMFNLTVIDDDTAPSVTSPVGGRPASGAYADPTFEITNDKKGKYYYVALEADDPTVVTADYIITNGSRVNFTNDGSQSIPRISGLDPSKDYKVYLVAKDLVRNTSPILEFDLPTVPPIINQPPAVLPSLANVKLGEGFNTTLEAIDIASDPDNDPISITMRDNSATDSGVAVINVSGGKAHINGIGAGSTTVKLRVEDNHGNYTIITVTIDVTGATNEPSVNPPNIRMKPGDSKTIELQLGLGASASSSATIVSGDTSVVTVSQGSITNNGHITATGINDGTTNITITWDNNNGITTIPVVVDSGYIPPDPTDPTDPSDPPVKPQYKITYSETPSSGGSVTAKDNSGASVSSGDSIKENTIIYLTASPASGYKFSHWTINDVTAGVDNPISVNMNKDTRVQAVFSKTDTGGNNGGNGSTGGRPSGGGGSGGGGGRSILDNSKSKSLSRVDSSLLTSFIVDTTKANASLSIMNSSDSAYASIRHEGIIKVLAEAFKTFGNTPVHFDTMDGKAVQVRIKLTNPELQKSDMLLSGRVKGSDVDARQKFLENWYSNKMVVIHLDQVEEWGQTVSIAAKVNLTGMDTENLHFYSYNKTTNTYAPIAKSNYHIDAHGYLHFETNLAGDIFVTDSPLKAK